MTIIRVILILLALMSPLNTVNADTIFDRDNKYIENYIELLKQAKEVECIANVKPYNTRKSSSFLCNSDGFEHRIFIYQIDSYRLHAPTGSDYFNAIEKKLSEYYKNNTEINLQLINENVVTFLSELIDNKKVAVKFSDHSDGLSHVNKSRKTSIIGTVYLDNIDVGLKLIEEGFAWASPPNWPNNKKYNDAQKIAQEKQLGFWAHSTIPPWEVEKIYNKIEKEEKAKILDKSKENRKPKLIEAWLFFIGIPLGFIALIYVSYKIDHWSSIFLLIIPYMVLGINMILIKTSIYDDRAIYYFYGFFTTIPVAVCSFVIGLISLFIQLAKKDKETNE